jgi:hypothetical protein
LLEHSDKWRLRHQEAPLKKAEFVTLDDPEDSDEPKGKNKGTDNPQVQGITIAQFDKYLNVDLMRS